MKSLRFCPHSEKELACLIERLQKAPSENATPFLIGIGGPGGCGKTTFTQWLSEKLPECEVLTLDDFRLPRQDRPAHAPFGSHPEAVDMPRLFSTLEQARLGKPFSQPHFDLNAGRALTESSRAPAKIVLVDGEITAYSELRPYLDTLILVQASLWNQWRTRTRRDRSQRGCSFWKTLRIFMQSNLKDYPRFSGDAETRADLVFYRNRDHSYRLSRNQLNACLALAVAVFSHRNRIQCARKPYSKIRH